MKTIEISINVCGSVHQTIELKEEMTPEKFRAALKSGEVVTSVGHGENKGKVYRIETAPFGLVEIGRVIEQEAGDDLEISLDENYKKEIV